MQHLKFLDERPPTTLRRASVDEEQEDEGSELENIPEDWKEDWKRERRRNKALKDQDIDASALRDLGFKYDSVSSEEEEIAAAEQLALERAKHEALTLERMSKRHNCEICMDEWNFEEMLFFYNCDHGFCRECMNGYCSAKIMNNEVLQIVCPNEMCKKPLEYHEIKQVINEEVFVKYERFALIEALKQDPNTRWCPKPGCENVMIGHPDIKKMQCDKCHSEICFECNDIWHEGITCADSQYKKVDHKKTDKKFKKWIKDNAKKCPKCKTPIEKISGCHHMTCSSCHYQFCWLCGGKYTSKHFEPYNVLGCPGMQSASTEKFGNGTLKRVGVRMLLGTGMVVGSALAVGLGIPAVIIGAPIVGVGYMIKKHRRRRYKRND